MQVYESLEALVKALSNEAIALRRALIESVLLASQPFWREMPFRVERPQWVNDYPDLDDALQSMPAERLATLLDDNRALVEWLGDRVAIAGYRADLLEVPAISHSTVGSSLRAAWGVPGRKRAQIEAFAAATANSNSPVLEWCAGKGHLGRLVSLTHGVSVTSLEIDAELCRAGEALASRAGASTQAFVAADAFSLDATRLVSGRHVMALHACGDLHRDLVVAATTQGAAGLAVSPCCYYRLRETRYQPFCTSSRLELSRDDLHLAVTETVTAPGRGVRERDRATQWKLAFVAWRETQTAVGYQTFKPVPSAWLSQPFAEFISRLCEREGLATPPSRALADLLQQGERRFALMMRRSVVRLAFRRLLELWLVCDLAEPLISHGFDVSLGVFCDRKLTPRNLMLRATARS